MDPALSELIADGPASEQVRVVARLAPAAEIPAGVEVVSRFGDVATCRIARGRLEAVWAAPEMISLKAPRTLDAHPVLAPPAAPPDATADDQRRPDGLPETGAGVVLACLDWGLDFAHPDLRTRAGQTRLLALWDQRGGSSATTPYGYGRVHTRADIDVALRRRDPYAALGYHPADADLGHGAHGTHCMSIAAGTGSRATAPGMAPGADLIFVHLDSPRGDGVRALGDWATLLDGLDFCLRLAGERPLVISLSLGSCGGPHDGSSPVERALDHIVTSSAGRAICQSAGNYFASRGHSSGRLRPGEVDTLGWVTRAAVANPHELEVWYANADRFVARLTTPDGRVTISAGPAQSQDLVVGGAVVGRLHHRLAEPNNGRNHIDVFLYPGAPAGRYELALEGSDVADGRYHVWLEREAGVPGRQAHLEDAAVISTSTTNSVCNGERTITVGAYDATDPDRPLASFSSSGPTIDGRLNPDVIAPGVRIRAARSTPHGAPPGARATVMSGTSMATPFVAGTVALMFEAAGRPLTVAETRRALSRTAVAVPVTSDETLRAGDGYVDVRAAVARVRAPALPPRRPIAVPNTEEDTVSISAPIARNGGPTIGEPSPADLFDRGLADGDGSLIVIAAPGTRLDAALQAGDLLVHRIRGERHRGSVATIVDGHVHRRGECELGAATRAGFYVHVLAGAGEDPVCVWVADSGRRLSSRDMVLRPATSETPAEGAEHWPGAAVEDSPAPAVDPGRLVIAEVPLLATHHGTHPDLVLRWNAMPAGTAAIDVVVHFHGYSGHAAAMRIDRDKEPRSGLDFTNPDNAADPLPGRSRPTLGVLPRGNFFGGHSGAGYDHPALVTTHGLQDLIAYALDRFAEATGVRATTDRLLLTGHSGGGAGIMGALRHNDPDEVHVFDGLYGPPDHLIAWARRRLEREHAGGATSALRIVYIEGAGTSEHSKAVLQALRPQLDSAELVRRYRAEATRVAHNDIPRRFGWRLLADAGGDLPGVRRPPAEALGAERAAAPAAEDAGRLPAAEAAGALPAEDIDPAVLQAQWDAHPRVHGWFDGGLETYLHMAPLYASHGIDDAAAYLDAQIVTAHLLGHAFPAHRALAEALAQADRTLAASSPAVRVHSVWSVNARAIRGRATRLSLHALGLAVDIDPSTNPLIRATDDHDIVRVIAAVTGVDLGATQTPEVLRQASATFRATYGDDWLAARRTELDGATAGGDDARAATLRALLASAARHATRLRALAARGFFDLDPRLVDALRGAGLSWGGSWRTSKDLMHFELPSAVPAARSEAALGGEAAPAAEAAPAGEAAPTAEAVPADAAEDSSAVSSSGAATGTLGAPLPGAGVTLTADEERRIAARYPHVVAFVRRYRELAVNDQHLSGVPATFTLAQGGLESGWGRHMPGNMLFGVKASLSLPESERQLVWTHEVVRDPHHYDAYDHGPATPLHDPHTGEPVTAADGAQLYRIRVRLWFRRFDSDADAIANHSHVLRAGARYAPAFQHSDDPVQFAREVARAGYATGPSYEQELVSAISLVNRVAAYLDLHPDAGAAPEGSSTLSPRPPGPAADPLARLEGRYLPPLGTADAAVFSRAGTVDPVIDGRDYFAAIRAEAGALAAGDAWYLAGWWLDPGFRFADGTLLGDLLVDRAAAGVDVRVIVWANRQVLDHPALAGRFGAGPYARVITDNVRAAETLRARVDAAGHAPLAGRVLIDWSGNAASSHHMKFNVFSRGGAVSAYIGGIDFQQNRMSAPMHPPPELGWHDAAVRVTGDAAGGALATYVTRWTEASTLSAASYDIGAGSHPYNPGPLVALHPPTARPGPASPDTSIEVIRSFPDSKEFGLLRNTPWSTLPRTGVHEIKRTFLTAIGAAQRYIYIEDQSFDAVDVLFPALVDACQRGVKVIALIPGRGDPLDTPGALPATLSSAVTSGIVSRLSAGDRTNLAVWQLDGIVVHAKLMLIDDAFLSIGSANFMDRSMQFTSQGDDSEISVAAVSTGALVRDLRTSLWAEHLRVSGAAQRTEIADLGRSLGFWRPAWGSGLSFAHATSRLVFVGP